MAWPALAAHAEPRRSHSGPLDRLRCRRRHWPGADELPLPELTADDAGPGASNGPARDQRRRACRGRLRGGRRRAFPVLAIANVDPWGLGPDLDALPVPDKRPQRRQPAGGQRRQSTASPSLRSRRTRRAWLRANRGGPGGPALGRGCLISLRRGRFVMSVCAGDGFARCGPRGRTQSPAGFGRPSGRRPRPPDPARPRDRSPDPRHSPLVVITGGMELE